MKIGFLATDKKCVGNVVSGSSHCLSEERALKRTGSQQSFAISRQSPANTLVDLPRLSAGEFGNRQLLAMAKGRLRHKSRQLSVATVLFKEEVFCRRRRRQMVFYGGSGGGRNDAVVAVENRWF